MPLCPIILAGSSGTVINSLRCGKKSIEEDIQKELPVQLKARHLEHLLPQG